MSKWLTTESLPVWPRPAHATAGVLAASVLSTNDDLFVHGSGCCEELLQSAFSRARRNIFLEDEDKTRLLQRITPGMILWH